MKSVTIIGGGNSAHVLIPLLSKTELQVNLLTSRPKEWLQTIALEYTLPSGELVDTYHGRIHKISNRPKDVIPNSDILILCMPVHSYREALHKIAPYIDREKKRYIGTVYGQAGFNWMVEEIIQKFSIENITIFAFGLIPWISRTKIYGKSGIVYGAKPVNIAAVSPFDDFPQLDNVLFDKIVHQWFHQGAFRQANNFISLTLSLDNQIIHTSRLYGLFLESGGVWNKKENIPYFYRDFSLKSAQILQALDDDYSLIRNKIKTLFSEKKFTYMLDYLLLDNTTNLRSNKTILETFQNSKTLGAIQTPVVEENGKWVIDKKHRFFRDDIYYGLCIAKWIAQKLDLKVPHMDEVLIWAQDFLNDRIIENEKLVISEEMKKNPFKYGVPEVYGFSKVDQIID